MNKLHKAIKWAIQYLTANNKVRIISYDEIVQASYSTVYVIETDQDNFYLKITPEMLFLESKLLQYFQRQHCKNTSVVLSENNEFQCFLMSSSGHESLREYFKGKVDMLMLQSGISNYTRIQRQLESENQALISLGLPDWRLNKLPYLYHKLLQNQSLLLSDGLLENEIECLNQHYNSCETLCDELLGYGIPETINHCDFHENNMLFDKKSGEIDIIDWGESVITHPFLSLNGCLCNIVHFNDVQKNDSRYDTLRSASVDPWINLY